MIGRTHGVHAEPMTFGLKLALWYTELQRDLERLAGTGRSCRSGKSRVPSGRSRTSTLPSKPPFAAGSDWSPLRFPLRSFSAIVTPS